MSWQYYLCVFAMGMIAPLGFEQPIPLTGLLSLAISIGGVAWASHREGRRAAV